MTVKDHVIGTTKRLVGEIVGDGALADEGSRQASGVSPTVPRNDQMASDIGRHARNVETDISDATVTTEHDRIALLRGHVALNLWPDLPRDAQQQLFAAAADSEVIANSLAIFLHDRHPKTAHPAPPTNTA